LSKDLTIDQKYAAALRAIVDTMACNTARFAKNPGKDFTRERKLGFVQLIHFLLSMESGGISHELLKYFYFLCINFVVAMFPYSCRLFPDKCPKFLLLKFAPKLVLKNRKGILSVSFYAALMVILIPKIISNSFKASFNFSFSASSSTLIVAFGIDCNKGTAIKL